MSRILTITPNPSIDVSASVTKVEPMHKLRCGEVQRDAGGGGINVARVAQRLGAEVTAIFTASDMMGGFLQQLVAQEDVSSHTVPIREETREDFTVSETTTRDQYRFVLPGPRLSEDEWKRTLAAFDAHADGADLAVASGSLPPGVPDDFYARLADTARSRDIKLLLDVSGAPLAKALDQGVYLVKPNLRELRELVGTPLDDETARVEACAGLVHAGKAQVVALTLGHAGALLVSSDGAWRADPIAVDTVSAVGAGDSFLGAMAWALASGKPLNDAFRYGCAAGSAALLSPGTALCDPADVRRLVERVVLTSLCAV